MEFLCPNGHKIRCPAEQAGRAAKCPRCGVKFRIPDPASSQVSDSSGGDSDVSQPELTDSGIGIASTAAPDRTVAEEPQIEFLCPNGHRLHGPANLQNRPGECPECGSRFRIPTYEDIPEEEGTEQQISIGPADNSDQSSVRLPQFVQTPDIEHPQVGHPLAKAFAELWAEKAPQVTVELHLRNGDILLPDRFAEALSQQTHGVFALSESGGTYTLTVVAWDSVVRILLKDVKELPEEMSS
jgi:DNA-directed RNA polymerase subunit RPC12/RpoP